MATRDQIERIATILARATSDNENEAAKALESTLKRMNRDGVTVQDLLSLPEEKLYQDALVRLADIIVKSRDDLSPPKRRELYAAYLGLIVEKFSGGAASGTSSSKSGQSGQKRGAGQGAHSKQPGPDPFDEWKRQEKERWEQKRREAEERERKAQWEREQRAREAEANRKYQDEQARNEKAQREREERQAKEDSHRRSKEQRTWSSGMNDDHTSKKSTESENGNTPKQEYTFSFSSARSLEYWKGLLEPGSFAWCSWKKPGRAFRLLAASSLFGIGFSFLVLLGLSLVFVLTNSRMPFDSELSTAFAFPAALGIILKARSLHRNGWFRY